MPMSLRLLWLLLLLVPLAARADVPGIDLYERGEYEFAIRVLKQEINDTRNSAKDRARARVYLAASMHALGMTFEAREVLKELARQHPEQRVDPDLFPPELVEMAEQARAAVKKEPARREPPGPRGEPAIQDEAPSPGPTFRLRPEATGFIDMTGRPAWGLTAGATVGLGSLEASARLVLGRQLGVTVEGGWLFGSGALQPRVALRFTSVPGLPMFGGGAAVGARLALSPQFVALADVSAEYLSAKQGYEQFILAASLGLGFELFPS